jgi:CheY-like chemotaxis protein
VFEPFFTAGTTGGGAGLGLSIVYGIVRQSGGYVVIESEPGQGTAFRIYLPRIQDERVARVEVGQTRAHQVASETVLLVEDEDLVRHAARRILAGHGYEVLEARHGGDALLVCEQYRDPIHLMVTDVVMPGMSGHELAERLTRRRPGMKVLYISGYTENTVFDHGVPGDRAWFVQKPFTARSLLDKVRLVLDRVG